MKRQLSTLQQLIAVMDPELHAHLEKTGSLNLFFCFRWILIAFKREFAFDQVIRLWEVCHSNTLKPRRLTYQVLWTNYYSNQFVLFVALAVLQSHREVILRYLTEFDEVLKYANDLSGTIDLDTTLAQAEVLFLSFRDLIADVDYDTAADAAGDQGLRRRRGSSSSHRSFKNDSDKSKVVAPALRDLLIHSGSEEESPVLVDVASSSGPARTTATQGRSVWLQNTNVPFM